MTPLALSTRRPLLYRLLASAASGVALGHIAAVVVADIHRVLDWVPLPSGITTDDLAQVPNRLIHTEQTREVATIMLLLALGTPQARRGLLKGLG